MYAKPEAVGEESETTHIPPLSAPETALKKTWEEVANLWKKIPNAEDTQSCIMIKELLPPPTEGKKKDESPQGWNQSTAHGGKMLKGEGDMHTRYAPCSSFQMALALMGYDAGILQDETQPRWSFKKGDHGVIEDSDYVEPDTLKRRDQTPTLWMESSSVWYSSALTKRMGMKKFQEYMRKFAYGNGDISGDKGKKNGLTHAWMSSSLSISPGEQMAFLEKLLTDALPCSAQAHKMTRAILFVEDLPQGWKLYGKTGSGYLLDKKGAKTKTQHGWFVGWIERAGSKGIERILLVQHVVDQKPNNKYFAGGRAQIYAKNHLVELMKHREIRENEDRERKEHISKD